MNRKAQSTLEYSMLITITVATLGFMFVYIQRAMQGNFWATLMNVGQVYYAPEKTVGSSVTVYRVTEHSVREDKTSTIHSETHQDVSIDENVLQ